MTMRHVSTAKVPCSIARALDIVGEWWTLIIVRDIGLYGVHRFGEIQERLGIARNVLTARLGRMQDEGIIEAIRYQERPERFEYHLTQKGRELFPVLYSLLEWGDRWTRDDPPPARLEHGRCGHVVHTSLSCPHCETIVSPEETRLRLVRARHPIRR